MTHVLFTPQTPLPLKKSLAQMTVRIASITTLGKRPVAVNNLNGESFQQDPLVAYNGWQYCAAYVDKSPGYRRVQLSRRKLPDSSWESIVFDDYTQIEDDGHNVICIGICHDDGSIHISWDLHSSQFNYRQSICDLVNGPGSANWGVESFGPVLHALPGLEQSLHETTYPRFLSLPRRLGGALLLDLRTGISGLGDEWLYVYEKGKWTSQGVYLKGVENNAYVNGLDVDDEGTLHVTWCYRDYVDHPKGGKPQQAGPNGPENNHDLCYAYSPCESGYPGRTWYSADGIPVRESVEQTIEPRPETVVFEIPKWSGILNQEAQCISADGVHVLNRENVSGSSRWFHYLISRAGHERTQLSVKPMSPTSARGKLVYRGGRVLALLHNLEDLVVLDIGSGQIKCRVAGAGGLGCQEVLYDRLDTLLLFRTSPLEDSSLE